MIITQTRITEGLISEALKQPDYPVLNTFHGSHMVGITSPSGTGLASVISGLAPGSPVLESHASLHSIVQSLIHQETIHASWGLAAVNTLLNPGSSGPRTRAQDLIRTLGKARNVAVIGHFPFVEKMVFEFRNLWVLEKSPGTGDLHENLKTSVLPRADVVAMTATTLLNGTLAEILHLIPEGAVKIMLGPSTPLASTLFDLGFDYLGGAIVTDPVQAAQGIQQGFAFRHLQGVDVVLLPKSGPARPGSPEGWA
ncbi:MAG: Rossmann-like domain-containing protein [Desulfonatronovibrionaceae bacterium]